MLYPNYFGDSPSFPLVPASGPNFMVYDQMFAKLMMFPSVSAGPGSKHWQRGAMPHQMLQGPAKPPDPTLFLKNDVWKIEQFIQTIQYIDLLYCNLFPCMLLRAAQYLSISSYNVHTQKVSVSYYGYSDALFLCHSKTN